MTADYEILLRDNLLGLYEYHLRFDSGGVAYVNEVEIVRNIKLVGIRVESH